MKVTTKIFIISLFVIATAHCRMRRRKIIGRYTGHWDPYYDVGMYDQFMTLGKFFDHFENYMKYVEYHVKHRYMKSLEVYDDAPADIIVKGKHTSIMRGHLSMTSLAHYQQPISLREEIKKRKFNKVTSKFKVLLK